MRQLILTTLLLSGCAHASVAESLSAAQAGLGLAAQAAAAAAEQYCALVPEDECKAMQEATGNVIETMAASEVLLHEVEPLAVDIDKAIEARKAK